MNLFKPKSSEPDPDDENSIDGERAITPVNKGLTIQNRITNWAVIGGLCLLTGFFLYKYYAGMYREYDSRKTPPRDLAHTVATTNLPPLSMPAPVPDAPSPVSKADGQLPPLQPVPNTTGALPASAQMPAKSPMELIRERRLKRELRFNLDGPVGGSAAQASESKSSAPEEAGVPAAQGTVAPGTVKASASAQFSPAHAFLVPDPTLIMTRGKVIPCTVQPAIDTTLTGIVTCITGEDASGADNKVSLMDRGTICVGKQGGGVTHGQRRVGIIWQRCETPQHVLVPLESDAADALGRPGLAGQVDNHFWDRFGAAIALSLISDIGPYLIASRQGDGNNNTTIAFPNILNGPQAIMGEVLRSMMDIQPTVTTPQGARVLIYLAGDIDFRDVYQLERSK
jgi:type IV secretion system protein VirB10